MDLLHDTENHSRQQYQEVRHAVRDPSGVRAGRLPGRRCRLRLPHPLHPAARAHRGVGGRADLPRPRRRHLRSQPPVLDRPLPRAGQRGACRALPSPLRAGGGAVSAVPVVTLCSTDAVLRGSAAGSLLCDLPGAVVLQHDIDIRTGGLRRVIYDSSGVLSDTTRRLEHACASCATREDILPALTELVSRQPTVVVLALPTALEAVPLLHAIRTVPGAVAAGVATVVDLDTVLPDIAAPDLLIERDLAAAAEDERMVAEVVVSQLESADVVLCAGEGAAQRQTALALVAHLAGPGAAVPWHSVPTERLLSARPGPDRGDLRAVAATEALPAGGVWTVDLS